MAEEIDNFEMVSVYRLNDDDREALLLAQKECSFNWCTRDSWPMGVIMSYIWRKDRIWLTAGGHRHRISAVRRNPKVSIVITSTGTELGRSKTITIKGRCVIHEDRETKDWFYPDFAMALRGNQAEADEFAEMLDSPLRVILEVIPEKWITYDGIKMGAHSRGELDPSELAEPLESDTVRLAKEIEKRGL